MHSLNLRYSLYSKDTFIIYANLLNANTLSLLCEWVVIIFSTYIYIYIFYLYIIKINKYIFIYFKM